MIPASENGFKNWQSERDSNPRDVAAYTISNRAPSTTRTPLCVKKATRSRLKNKHQYYDRFSNKELLSLATPHERPNDSQI